MADMNFNFATNCDAQNFAHISEKSEIRNVISDSKRQRAIEAANVGNVEIIVKTPGRNGKRLYHSGP